MKSRMAIVSLVVLVLFLLTACEEDSIEVEPTWVSPVRLTWPPADTTLTSDALYFMAEANDTMAVVVYTDLHIEATGSDWEYSVADSSTPYYWVFNFREQGNGYDTYRVYATSLNEYGNQGISDTILVCFQQPTGADSLNDHGHAGVVQEYGHVFPQLVDGVSYKACAQQFVAHEACTIQAIELWFDDPQGYSAEYFQLIENPASFQLSYYTIDSEGYPDTGLDSVYVHQDSIVVEQWNRITAGQWFSSPELAHMDADEEFVAVVHAEGACVEQPQEALIVSITELLGADADKTEYAPRSLDNAESSTGVNGWATLQERYQVQAFYKIRLMVEYEDGSLAYVYPGGKAQEDVINRAAVTAQTGETSVRKSIRQHMSSNRTE